jgi:hypothetical protein
MRMNIGEYFHVGIIVPDLGAARARLGELLGTEWGPIVETDVDVRDGAGRELVLPNRVCFSTRSPYIELIQETPGSPWVCNPHSNLHHIGFFSRALAAESDRLRAARCPLEIMGGHGKGPPGGWAYHRDALGVRIEVVDDAMRPTMEQMLMRPPGSGEGGLG